MIDSEFSQRGMKEGDHSTSSCAIQMIFPTTALKVDYFVVQERYKGKM